MMNGASLMEGYIPEVDATIVTRILDAGACKCIIVLVPDFMNVRKGAKIRNRYNQVPRLTQNTTWESDKNITNESQVASLFPGSNEQTRNVEANKTQLWQCHHYTQN